jgi:hypothetical protein
MRRFVSPQLATWLYAAGALAIGCSFQEFDYLQDGGTISSQGGTASAGSGATQGGTKPDGQSGAGAPGGAGTAPTAGKGGKGGEPTQLPEGGTTGEAGAGGVGGAGGADGTGATGATGELLNPSFETLNTVGWTVEPAGTYAFVQLPQGTDKNPDGAYEFSTWHDTATFTVELYQNIKGLEDGKYTLKAYISSGPNNVSLFARKCGGAVEPDPVVVPTQTWTPVEVKGIEVVGGSCEVGLHVESTARQWMNADLFTFEKDAD